MDQLRELLHCMEPDELRHASLLMRRSHDDAGRKDIELMHDYPSFPDDPEGEEGMIRKFASNRNAFYQLKHRLLEHLNTSLQIQHQDKDEELRLYQLAAVGQILERKGNLQLAVRYLEKAIRMARKLELYEWLDVLYGRMIQLSTQLPSLKPESWVQQRQENRQNLQALGELEDLLAISSRRLRLSFNLSDQTELARMLEQISGQLRELPFLQSSMRIQTYLYQSVIRTLLGRKDYISMERYLKETYSNFIMHSLFGRQNHETRLQMLTYLCNTLTVNRKHAESLEYAEQLREAMEMFDRSLHGKYLIYYYNTLVINYTTLDKPRAIQILEDLIRDGTFDSEPVHDLFLHFNLAIYCFDLGQADKAARVLARIYIRDGFRQADEALQLRIRVFELMVRFEQGDWDLLARLGQAILREYRNRPVNAAMEPQLLMCRILLALGSDAGKYGERSTAFQSNARELLRQHHSQLPVEAGSINYVAWLEKLSADETTAQ